MSLLLNMLSRLVITFLPRSKHLLILWLQSPSKSGSWGKSMDKVLVKGEWIPLSIHFTKSLLLGSNVTMKGFSAFLDMRRCKDWDHKICFQNICLKTCPTRLPGAQSALLHPELPQQVLKVSSFRSAGFSLRRGRWRMPLLFSRWQPSWQLPVCSWQQYSVPLGLLS